MKTQVVIAYSRTLVRQGLAALFRQHGYEVVGEPASGEDLRRLAHHTQPMVLLVDSGFCSPLETPCDEADLIACLRVHCPPCAILVLENAAGISGSDREAECCRALRQGATAYLPLDLEAMELMRIVKTALAAHGGPVSEGSTVAADAPASAHASLTERETEIVSLIVGGLCNKEIAHRLDIGPQTVKNHVHHLLEKLGFADRTQLAVWALEEGVVKHGG